MDNLQKARFNMIHQQIKPYAVTSNTVLNLMEQVPREKFVPEAYQSVAYTDTAIPVGHGHFLLQPKIVGRALQALDIKKNEKVLEIGCGTGYVTMLLSQLADHVYATEIEADLIKQAEGNLGTSCPNVTLARTDAVMGWEQHAPYQIIFVSGSYPVELPSVVLDQLAPGGRCFAIVGKEPAMQACLFTKKARAVNKQVLFETSVPALIGAPDYPEFRF